MAKIFEVRGDSLDAWVATGSKQGVPHWLSPATKPSAIVDADASVFGGYVLDTASPSYYKNVSWDAKANFSRNAAFSIRVRLVPRFTGTGFHVGIIDIRDPVSLLYFRFQFLTGGQIYVGMKTKLNANAINWTTTATTSMTSGTAKDFMFSWDGTTNANAMKLSVDGVEFETATASAANDLHVTDARLASIVFGWNASNVVTNADLNNLEIWDTAENHVYTPRTDFDSTEQYYALEQPAESNVLNGVAYGPYTGSYDPDHPAESDVRDGTSFDSGAKTGTLDLPAESDVVVDVSYDNATKTGTRVVSSIALSNVTGSIGGRNMTGTVSNG